MAPESIQFRKYSQKSDVFSFGTFLWEIQSGGAIPFGFVAEDEEVARRVVGGARPDMPAECPKAVCDIMEKCWKQRPADRPTFRDLKFEIQDALGLVVAAESMAQKEEEGLCVVCLERPATFALLPCGHLCACQVDAPTLDQCPICRAAVQTRNRIFVS